jgi:PAS domain S-box-containing protein
LPANAETNLSDILIRNKYLEGIINSNEDRIFALDTAHCFIGFNESFVNAYVETLGKAPIIGEKVEYPYHSLTVSQTLSEAYQEAFRGSKAERLVDISGRQILVRASPLFDDTNAIWGIAVYSIDMTETIESRKKLKDSQEEFKKVIDTINDIVFRTSVEGVFTYLNQGWEKIMGFSLDESIGKSIFDFISPAQVGHCTELFNTVINNRGKSCTYELPMVSKDLSIKWIRISITLLTDEFEVITGTSGILTDVTDAKRNEHLYQLISNNIEDILSLHETDGTTLYAGVAVQQHLGYLQEELIGRKPFEFIHPNEREPVITRFAHNDHNNATNYLLYRFQHLNGTYRWLESHTKSIFDTFYNREIIIISTRVVDDRMEAEQKLMESYQKEKELNELKSKFVSMASHEFRTPMTAIKSCAEIAEMLLSSQQLDVDKAIGFLKTIDKEVDRMSQLIDEILNLGKIEGRNYFTKKERLDIFEIANDCVERQNTKQNDGRKIRIETIGKPQQILADATQIRHIIDNLISNAFKYSEGKKEPNMTFIFDDHVLQIHIKDHGIGIPKADQPKIFNMFFRARNTQNIIGTGVGLALVEKFVEMHNGKISFESIENFGSIFVISLPYSESKKE